jgi:threonine dehydratase
LEQVERPKQQAFQMDKSGKAKFLRQSTDEHALEGYFELARELSKIPDLTAVFIPTSSGTTAQALGQSFEKLNKNIQIHIVQTEACHPIAEEFDTPEKKTEVSCAGAIVDKVAHRKNEVINVIKNSHGSGWIVSDEKIREARKLVKNTTNIKISTNSALSIAGLKKAVDNNWKFDGVVCCVITGR